MTEVQVQYYVAVHLFLLAKPGHESGEVCPGPDRVVGLAEVSTHLGGQGQRSRVRDTYQTILGTQQDLFLSHPMFGKSVSETVPR